MKIKILITGGTFDKEYNELAGELFFNKTHVPEMLKLGRSRLDIKIQDLLMIDSLQITDSDINLILEECKKSKENKILITHGTDKMVETAKILGQTIKDKTIVLTGAIIPYAFGSSDGLFNLGSALAFVVAGMGDMLPRLIDEAITLGIVNNIIFTGLLTEDEVKHIYKIASVYVMPSVSEPFGITALEAVSAGTPVIVSKTAGVSEAFNNCLRVDFWDTNEMANKIVSLLRYEPLWNTLAEHGKREIELFTWDGVAENTLDVYKEVI